MWRGIPPTTAGARQDRCQSAAGWGKQHRRFAIVEAGYRPIRIWNGTCFVGGESALDGRRGANDGEHQ